MDPAAGDDLIHDPAGQIDRNGEAIAGVVPGLAGDGRVDADHLTLHAHQRTAGVARIDGRVGLDEVLDGAVGLSRKGETAAFRADDARGHREGEVVTQRVAYGQDPLAHPGRAAVAERSGDEVLGVDLEHREVGVRIGPDDLGLELAPVEQAHGHLIGAIDDVVVGEDVAVLGDDEARAGALLEAGLLLHRGHAPEELFEAGGTSIRGAFRRGLSLLAGLDVDDAGLDVLGDRREGLAQVIERSGGRQGSAWRLDRGRGLNLLLGRRLKG